MKVVVDSVIDTQSISCSQEDNWKLVIALCSCQQPHEKLLVVKMADSAGMFPKLEHVIENNDLVDILYKNIIKSNDDIEEICGNSDPAEYRVRFAEILHNLCLKNSGEEDIGPSKMKRL